MTVVKYILPQLIKKNFKIFLSLVLIAALGIGVLTAMLNTYNGVSRSMETYFKEYGNPDVTIMSTALFSEKELAKAELLEGISDVQGRLCVDVEAAQGDSTFVSMRCYSIGDEDFLRYYVDEQITETAYSATQGEQAKSPIPMAMEVLFAEYAGFEVGDIFRLSFPNGEYECILAAIVTSPEWVITYRDEYFNFSTDEFGYVLFSYEDLAEMTGVPRGGYNHLLVQTQTGTEAADVEQRLLGSGLFGAKPYSYTYETSPQKEYVETSVEPLKSLSYFLSIFFFLIAAIMIYLFLYQIVLEQKEQSGTLMALGASQGKIVSVYLTFGAGVSVMAGIIGSITGYFLMRLLTDIYRKVFCLPHVERTFDPGLALFAFLVMTLVAVLSVLLASLQIFRLDPSDAMRSHMSGSVGKPPGKLFSVFGYAAKVCLCNALRNKRRLVLSMLSTILTVTLISFAFQYVDAGKYVLKHTFHERFLYDCQVFAKNNSTKEETEAMLEGVEEITDSEFFYLSSITIETEGKQVSTTLYGLEEPSELLQNRDEKGKVLLPEEGIVLSRYTADELQVSVGDTVFINASALTVTGIHEENLIFVQYVTDEVFDKITEGDIYGAFLKLREDVSRAEIYSSLKDKAAFSYLSMKNAQEKAVEKRIANTEAGVYVVIIMSFLIGLVIIYNMSLINFKERKRVYATMLTLGMQEADIGRASFVELVVQYVISMLLGSLFGAGVGKLLLVMTSTSNKYYTKAFSLSSTVLIAVCVGVFMALGHLLALRQMKKIDIVEELKTKE